MIENEESVYKCDFEHKTLQQCDLFKDELIEETCPELICTPSEFLRSLDNLDGMNDFQLPFRDKTVNFGVNGHYAYLQNMNSDGKVTKAVLRLKRTISNRLEPMINQMSVNRTNACKMKFFLRTNGYNLVNYDIFVDLLSSNKLVPIETNIKFSKLNFYESQVVNFENITEPFQILIQGSIVHNYLNRNTFIYMAIDDLSLTKDCEILFNMN